MEKQPIRVQGMYGPTQEFSSWNPFKYFESEYDKLTKLPKVDIMVSHYSPIVPIDDMPREYAKSPVSTFYYFDGKSELERIDPDYWIFGHTHDEYDFQCEGTTLLCNPVGYPGEGLGTQVKTIDFIKEK
jgi:predicted phosphodiesterase